MHIFLGRKRGTFVIFIAVLIFLSMGCDKLEKLKIPFLPWKKNVLQPKGTVIAEVGDLYITLEQLEQEIKNYNELAERPDLKITTREQKLYYLKNELIRRYLLYLEAKARHLDEQPKNQELLRNVEINVLATQLLQDEIGNLTVAPAEVEDVYNQVKGQYQLEEERRIREIVLDDEAAAKDALIELLKGADFAALAKERSRATSAANGGDLGFIKKGQRGADFTRFDAIAFSPSLEVGQTSNIFKDKEGYYIIKLEGKRGGQTRPLSEVWDEIKGSALFIKQQQKLQEIADNLSKKTKVVVYDDKIN